MNSTKIRNVLRSILELPVEMHALAERQNAQASVPAVRDFEFTLWNAACFHECVAFRRILK